MEIITKVLTEALVDKNLSYVALLDVCIGLFYFFNIALGAILGAKNEGFNLKKFLFGIIKSLCIMAIIVGVCYALNVFVLVINLIDGLEISVEIVTTMEMIAVLVGIGQDLATELLDKIKNIKEMKYISLDDIKVSDTNVVEPTELKG